MRAVRPLRTLLQEKEQAFPCIVKATSERVDVVKRAKAILAVRAGKPLYRGGAGGGLQEWR